METIRLLSIFKNTAMLIAIVTDKFERINIDFKSDKHNLKFANGRSIKFTHAIHV